MIDKKALLLLGIMWNKKKTENLEKVLKIIENKFGKVVKKTQEFTLSYSSYYEKEMGEGLLKSFFVIDCLINREESVNIKHYCMNLEDNFRENGGRTVNIDPVYLDEYQVVALSHKYKGSRVYIGKGVYGEIELLYHHGSFQPLIWTYLDYKENIPFFNEARKYYLEWMDND
ncbi:DUF4416 family protein [Sulfurihydrogenibium azorense]|uniref:DUF4416 family protein n=1 Tax=Sulfurihydrogenibium azorense TaxID=309806 RepID=UPI00240909C1|nr:DUF4416 family protein [Sulfurihydrogenibium azorense]MDM7274150.1 DUF4416 family protein [Sulfurihydrogenibium azorense]